MYHQNGETHFLKHISSTTFTQTPRVRLVISVIKRFDSFLSFALAHLCRICNFEESWSQFNKPFRIYYCDLPHVLLCGHHQLMVDHPVRLSLEKSTARMDVHWLVLNQGPIALLRVLSSTMEKESCSNCLPDFCKISSSTHDVQFISAMQH